MLYEVITEPDLGQCKFRARNKWLGGNHNCTTVTGFYGARQEIAHKQQFELHADEPPILAGHDEGANPVEHLLNALAACVTTSMAASTCTQRRNSPRQAACRALSTRPRSRMTRITSYNVCYTKLLRQ